MSSGDDSFVPTVDGDDEEALRVDIEKLKTKLAEEKAKLTLFQVLEWECEDRLARASRELDTASGNVRRQAELYDRLKKQRDDLKARKQAHDIKKADHVALLQNFDGFHLVGAFNTNTSARSLKRPRV